MADIQIAITAKNDASAQLAAVNADLANLADNVQATNEAMSNIDIPPISLTAVDNVTPTLDEIKSKTANLATGNDAIPLEVGDEWRAPIDELQARIAETKANAATLQQEFAKVTGAPPTTLAVRDNATGVINEVKSALGTLESGGGNGSAGNGRA